MKKFICEKCTMSFTRKYHLKRHLNKKVQCNNILPNLTPKLPNLTPKLGNFKKDLVQKINDKTCYYCNKTFTRRHTVTKHIKLHCNILKQINKEREEIYDKLIQLENENTKIKKEINILKNQKVNNTNNITNYNNTTNNIIIVAYNPENIKNIDNKLILNALKRGYRAPLHLINSTHFNTNHPEYHNVYIPSMKEKYIMIYNGNTWELKNANEVIDNMYDNNIEFIEENLEEFCNSLTKPKLRALNNLINIDDHDNNIKKTISNLKDDIKLLLHNKRKIPLNAKKN